MRGIHRRLIGAILSVVCSAAASGTVSAANETKLVPLGLQEKAAKSLNPRLFAIANAPDLLRQLDQRQNFLTNDGYSNMLAASLEEARRSLPSVFSGTNFAQARTAVCLADSRVFFWLPKGDDMLVGWFPLVRRVKPQQSGEHVVLWLVPSAAGQTPLSAKWSGRASLGDDGVWMKGLLKATLDCDVRDGSPVKSNGVSILRGLIESSGSSRHVKVTATQSIVETRISPHAVDEVNTPGKPVLPMRVLNDLPVDLPFWPPKDP